MILCFIPLCLHSSWILSSLTLLQELDEWVHKIACFVNAERESGLFSSLSMTILWTRIIGMRLNCAFSSKEQNFCYFTQFISCTANPIWPWTSMYVFWSSLPARTVLKTLHTDEVWKSKLFKSPLPPPPFALNSLIQQDCFSSVRDYGPHRSDMTGRFPIALSIICTSSFNILEYRLHRAPKTVCSSTTSVLL